MTRHYNRHVDQMYFSRFAHNRLTTVAELRTALAGAAAPLGAFGKQLTTTGKTAETPGWLELN